MAFFVELSEGAITGQGKIPNETLSAEHINNYTAAFMGMDATTVKLTILPGTQSDAPTPDDDDEDEDDKCGLSPG